MNLRFTIAALCLACGATSSFAQSNVTIYGLLDVGLTMVNGGKSSPAAGGVPSFNGGTQYLMTPGNEYGSRLGFRGTEDLGSGLSALFTLEMGMTPDTGALDQGGLGFGRQAFVGLQGSLGRIMFGRQYSPYWDTIAAVDPFITGLAPRINNIFPAAAYVRVNNAVRWNSPVWNGVSTQVMYGLGEQAGEVRAGHQGSITLGYAAGPLMVRLSHHRGNTSSAQGAQLVLGNSFQSTILGGTYDFGVVKMFAAVDANRTEVLSTGVRSTDCNDFIVGLSAPLGSGTFLASAVHRNDHSNARINASQYGVGYLYKLSNRTNLYSSYGTIRTADLGSSLKVPNASGPTAAQVALGADAPKRELTVGIMHSF